MLERGKMDRDLVEFVVIDQLVPKEHLLRKIDAAVDFTQLYEMVEPLYCEDNGRPSIDPVVLFKMVLIQHLYGLPSLRRTAEEVSANNCYRWFLGYPLQEETPHFSTMSYNFRHRFTEETVDRVFAWILDEVAKAGYLSPKAVFIDGTHIKANANTKKQMKEQIPAAARNYAKDQGVKNQQQAAQGHAPADTQSGHGQEDAHTYGHSDHQNLGVDGGDLLGQNLEIGLRHGAQHTQEEVDQHGKEQAAGPAQRHAHPVSHGDHGHVYAQRKKAHPQNEQHSAEEEQDQRAWFQRRNGDGQNKDDGGDGKDGGHGFPVLFGQLFVEMQGSILLSPEMGSLIGL
nr:transposase [Pseudoflavonifractor phocaeensis]